VRREREGGGLWVLVGYLVERSEADLAAILPGLVAGRRRRRRRRGGHGHASSLENQEREVKEKREEKGREAYGMDGRLFDLRSAAKPNQTKPSQCNERRERGMTGDDGVSSLF
jgi:hypothetical protein